MVRGAPAGRPQQVRSLLTRARADLLAVPDPYDAARALATWAGRTPGA
ncbi:hypothetical protein ACH4FX_17720 [Streptomyces sp. NPDC018019]